MKNESKDNNDELFIDPLIHVPARFKIISNLYLVDSADFLFLLKQTGLTKGNLSSHLSKLEAAAYIEIEKEFVNKIPRTTVALSLKGREAFSTYRANMKKMLDDLEE